MSKNYTTRDRAQAAVRREYADGPQSEQARDAWLDLCGTLREAHLDASPLEIEELALEAMDSGEAQLRAHKVGAVQWPGAKPRAQAEARWASREIPCAA